MRAALIADDLTGANNAGVLVAKGGLSTITVVHARPMFPADCEVACIDTDSRYAAPEDARARVRDMARWAAGAGAGAWCNRVDNLLRGNIGAETAGVLDHLGSGALAVVSPAFPALGRHVVDGHLLVNGAPVTENPVAANDPFNPVRHSRIGDLIGEQMPGETAYLGRDAVDGGAAALAARLDSVAASGVPVAVVDGQSDDDVAVLAEALARMTGLAVPVDPGPLSACYLRALRDRELAAAGGRKVLLAIGSVTPVTQGQVAHLIARRRIDPVWLDPEALIDAAGRDAAIRAAVDAALARLGDGDALVVTTRHPDHEPLDLDGLGRALGETPYALSKRISDGLAEAALAVIEASGGAIGGCFPSGGDVTASLFEAAGTEAIRIFDDVIPLTAHVAFQGGRLDGLRLVTKGGSIGDEDAMEACLSFLLGDLARR